MAMHIFVPGLPEAARDLGASIGAMQMTVSAYLFGLAVGQLVYGRSPIASGRRPVLMAASSSTHHQPTAAFAPMSMP